MQILVADASHAKGIAQIYEPYVRETPISFEEEAPSCLEMAARISETTEVYPWLVAFVGSDLAGFAYACAHRMRASYRWSVDVSAYVDPRFQRRGIASALYGRLLALLREQGFGNAYAGIALPNEASVRLHESFGFRKIAHYSGVGFKLGRWHDTGWWELVLNEKRIPAGEPVRFSELRERSGL